MAALVLVLVFALGGQACAAGPGGARSTLSWGGLERAYVLHRPPSPDGARRLPALIVLHGGHGDADRMDKLATASLRRLAAEKGVLLVYPEGIRYETGVRTRWNDGRSDEFSTVDDVGVLSALIDRLVATCNADPGRVYVAGISNGAGMALRVACDLSDKVAGVAAVAASMTRKLSLECRPSRPVPVLIMTGTKDPFVPWEGGTDPGIWWIGKRGERARSIGEILPVPEGARFWARANGCPPAASVAYEPDRDPKDGTRVRRETFGPCRGGSRVALYAVEGGGHTWPGGWQYLPELMVGRTSRDIDANDVICRFFGL